MKYSKIPKVNNSSSSAPQVFSGEEAVKIIGYEGDAMEPSISGDGKFLFWNSLNDGKDTSVYHAKRVDDTTFESQGKVSGLNGEIPHLDGVPSIDNQNELYWVSTRNYPKVFENYQRASFKDGAVTGVSPVLGDFYKREIGRLVMDAEVSKNGKSLVYVLGRFTGAGLPKETYMGSAQKVGETFIKDGNSDLIFKEINDKKYISYAPAISSDGLLLLFTRLEKGNTKIYMSMRNSVDSPFSNVQLVQISGNLPEGPSLTTDSKRFYYHKKVGDVYRIFSMKKV